MSDGVEQRFTVGGELGLHARPAGRFVAIVARYDCEVEVGRGEDWVNGASVLSILSLAAGPGTELVLRASGPDADAVVAELGALIESAGEVGAGG